MNPSSCVSISNLSAKPAAPSLTRVIRSVRFRSLLPAGHGSLTGGPPPRLDELPRSWPCAGPCGSVMRRKKLPRSFMAATASRTSPHSRPQKRAEPRKKRTKRNPKLFSPILRWIYMRSQSQGGEGERGGAARQLCVCVCLCV